MVELKTQPPLRTGLVDAPVIEGALREREQRNIKPKLSAGRRLFNWFKGSKPAQIVTAITLGAAMSQTPAGKDATANVLDHAGNIPHAVDTWLFNPKPEDNTWAKEIILRINGEPLKEGEHFVEEMIVVADQLLQEVVNVYPLNADYFSRGPVGIVGQIPVGTELNHVLITPGIRPSSVEPGNYGAVDCNVILGQLRDRDGKPLENTGGNLVCTIPVANLQTPESSHKK